MDHIQDVYKKKPDMINKIWDHLTKVNLKVDGKPFQVVYNEDEDELEYHGRSGNETKVGPLIDDMYRLFSKPINDAIRHIENRVEVFKRYKFLTFEVIDEILLLTAIITKEGKFVDDPDEIDEIAKELDTDVMPCLWKGKISDEQRDILMTAISTDIVPTKDDFVKWVKDLFGTYKKFPKTLISRSTEFIEGIVFFYDIDGKVVEYKLVDPSFRQMVKDNHANMKQDGIENAEKYTEIYTSFLNWAEENAKGLDKNRMRSIEFNFIEMMKDPKIYNKLMKDGAGLTTITTDAYFLQPDRISDELKKAIKKHGKVYQLLYEKFVRLFYKAKKRGFVLSKEFQARVNKAVEKFADYSLDEQLDIEINGVILSLNESHFENFNFSQYNKHNNEYAIAVIDYMLNNMNDNGEGKIDCGEKIDNVISLPFTANKKKLIELKNDLEENNQRNKIDVNRFNDIVTIKGKKYAWTSIFKGKFSGKIINTAGQQIEGYICYLFNNDDKNFDDVITWAKNNNIQIKFDSSWQKSSENTIKILFNFLDHHKLNKKDFIAIKKDDSKIDKHYIQIYNLFNLKHEYSKILKSKYSSPDKWNTADIILINKSTVDILNTQLDDLCKNQETTSDNINSWLKQQVEDFTLLPISLKKVSDNGNIYPVNLNDENKIEDITTVDIRYFCKDKEDSFKIHCNNSNYVIDFRLSTNTPKRPSIEGEAKKARTGKGTSVIKSMLGIDPKDHSYYENISNKDEEIFNLIKSQQSVKLSDKLKESDFTELIKNIDFCVMLGFYDMYRNNKNVNKGDDSFTAFMKFIIECCQTPATAFYIIK